MKLNILCCNPEGGAFLYITRGWEDAFKTLGHNFERWDGSIEQLNRFQPHLYLGCSGWRQSLPKWAPEEFGTRIGIHVNPWGDKKIKQLSNEPDINESEGAIKWVKKQDPDFLFCYALADDVAQLWNKWENHVAGVLPMPNAGNAVAYYPVPPDAAFKCDVGFIGGRWPYKAMNIDKYLIPVINKVDAQVYGWGGWQTPKYKGQIKDGNVNKLFSSAKICPSIVEPHTSRTGIDIPERMFKVPLGGGFTICDPCKGLERYVPKKIFPMASNPQEYEDLIRYYLVNDSERERLKKEQRRFILNNHTYFNRAIDFLKFAGYGSEAAEAKEKTERLINEMV